MKVITYVKKEINSCYVRVEHDVMLDRSAQETFEHWSNICYAALKQGRIVDYQVELIKH